MGLPGQGDSHSDPLTGLDDSFVDLKEPAAGAKSGVAKYGRVNRNTRLTPPGNGCESSVNAGMRGRNPQPGQQCNGERDRGG